MSKERKMQALRTQYEDIKKEYMILYHAAQKQHKQPEIQPIFFSNSLCSYSGNGSRSRGFPLNILNFVILKLSSRSRLSFSLSSSMVSIRSLSVKISFLSSSSGGTNPAFLRILYASRRSSGTQVSSSKIRGLPAPERLANSPSAIACLMRSSAIFVTASMVCSASPGFSVLHLPVS